MIRELRSEFIGRADELRALVSLIGASPLVTLTGIGGVGKTRLAVRAANAYAGQHGVACYFVPLESVHDASRVPLAVLRGLPIRDQSRRDPLDVIAEALCDKATILVLDNCEHLIDAAAAVVDHFLQCLPSIKVIATSRRPLEVDGEHVFPVLPLSVGDAADGGSEAVQLLVARACAAGAGTRFGEHEMALAVELCRELDGLPLSIELAATRMRTLPLEDLVRRLSASFTLLRGGSRNVVARQHTLRAVVDWSYELCTEEQRRVWLALSVFAGSFDLDAAATVVGAGEPAIVDVLEELVAQSVVEADRETGRFRLLQTIRRYGRDRAQENGKWEELVRRHLDHYRQVAARLCAAWHGPGQSDNVARWRADRAELHTALATALLLDRRSAAVMFSDLCYHWTVGGYIREGRAWAARILPAVDRSEPARRRALLTAAWLCILQADLDEATGLLDEVDASTPDEGADRLVGMELHRWRGAIAMFSGQLLEACDEFGLSIEDAHASGHPQSASFAQFLLSTAQSHLGARDAALPAERALACADAIGDIWMRAHALWAIALAALVNGEPEEARLRVREAVATGLGGDDANGPALWLELLAWIEAERAPHRAAVLIGAAESWGRRIGSPLAVHGPNLVAHHDHCVATLRSQLGSRSLRRMIASGAELDSAGAMAFALTDDVSADGLSAREREVAMRIHRGMSNREIAADLVVSVRTVDTHVQHILSKLDMSSRVQVAAWYEAEIATSNP